MRTITLANPKDLPKPNRLCIARTAQPDVRLPHPQWVRYHLITNKKRF